MWSSEVSLDTASNIANFNRFFLYSPFCLFLLIFRMEAVNGRDISEALPMDIDEYCA